MSIAESSRHTLLSFPQASEIVIAAYIVAMTYYLEMKSFLLLPIQSSVFHKTSSVHLLIKWDICAIEFIDFNLVL